MPPCTHMGACRSGDLVEMATLLGLRYPSLFVIACQSFDIAGVCCCFEHESVGPTEPLTRFHTSLRRLALSSSVLRGYGYDPQALTTIGLSYR